MGSLAPFSHSPSAEPNVLNSGRVAPRGVADYRELLERSTYAGERGHWVTSGTAILSPGWNCVIVTTKGGRLVRTVMSRCLENAPGFRTSHRRAPSSRRAGQRRVAEPGLYLVAGARKHAHVIGSDVWAVAKLVDGALRAIDDVPGLRDPAVVTVTSPAAVRLARIAAAEVAFESAGLKGLLSHPVHETLIAVFRHASMSNGRRNPNAFGGSSSSPSLWSTPGSGRFPPPGPRVRIAIRTRDQITDSDESVTGAR